jgi:hypothetical protein
MRALLLLLHTLPSLDTRAVKEARREKDGEAG